MSFNIQIINEKKMRMKMGILNLSKAPVHSPMPTLNKKKMEIQKVRKQMPSTGQMYEKMPLHGNLALYRNDPQMHRGGA